MRTIKTINALFLIICLTLLVGCANKNDQSIKSLNDNFNGALKFTEAVTDNNIEGFEYVAGFGGYSLKSVDELTSYYIGGYPDCLDSYKLIGFKTEDVKYEVFGFSVGDTIAAGEEALTKNGYNLKEQSLNSLLYKLNKITISLTGYETITSISVKLEITNKNGVVF